MKEVEYQVWIMGHKENGDVNDFEQFEASFKDYDKAEWFAENYEFSKPTITPLAKVVIEEVEVSEDNERFFVDRLYEEDL